MINFQLQQKYIVQIKTLRYAKSQINASIYICFSTAHGTKCPDNNRNKRHPYVSLQ